MCVCVCVRNDEKRRRINVERSVVYLFTISRVLCLYNCVRRPCYYFMTVFNSAQPSVLRSAADTVSLQIPRPRLPLFVPAPFLPSTPVHGTTSPSSPRETLSGLLLLPCDVSFFKTIDLRFFNPFSAWFHLKTTHKSAKFETLQSFGLLSRTGT